MKNGATQISHYSRTRFEAQTSYGDTISHDIYRRGAGAPVVLLQELPGIGQETLLLADELVHAGFEVVMPHLFGPLGQNIDRRKPCSGFVPAERISSHEPRSLQPDY